jgi:hypothetical protein
MNSELSNQLVCQCNGKLYKTKATLKSHQKSQIHVIWELPNKVKDLEIRATRLDNENGHLRRLNVLLLEKINTLEK